MSLARAGSVQIGSSFDLDQKVGELSLQLRELIAAKKGTQTTARTDVVLSESFWKQVAAQQREQRLRVEAEHKRLLQIVNSQNTYIENMGIGLRECPSSLNTLQLCTDTVDRFDDIKWLRLMPRCMKCISRK
ncbi:hypothetical protein GN244_ATG03038 [Phytophthora infestans]|uniref:Uncharacterized protein n=1 Tax=Phytophthora infestans TaxID=4787 RepID=A0A833WLE5_PHYIN|nr:hypothetical protein GN244_ATG03038 [Phytophthora infestans]